MSVQSTNSSESLSGTETPHPEAVEATRWTVGRRLWLGFAAVVVAMLLVMVAGFIIAGMIQTSFQVAEGAITELEMIGEMQALNAILVRETYEYLWSGKEETLTKVNAAAAQLDVVIILYGSAGAEADTKEGRDAAREITSRLQMASSNLQMASTDVIALYEQGTGIDELSGAEEELEYAQVVSEIVLQEIKNTMSESAREITDTMDQVLTGAYILVVTIPLAVIVLVLGIAYLLHRSIVDPVTNLTETTRRVAAGDLNQTAEVKTRDEMGMLAQAFNDMTAQVRNMLHSEQEQRIRLEKAERARERLQQQVIDAQRLAIQELSSPIIPLMDTPQGGIIAMPLVGSVDSTRARDITRALLVGIQDHRAKVVILDITGVPLVDSGVATYLTKTIQSARLKGARTIITGISDAVAETIVDLGIDWGDVITLDDMQTGIVVALNSMGIKLVE